MSNKLELTWVGKENHPRLEPRILVEDPEKSYHAKAKISVNDIFENKLIFGDNLLALKALEQEYAGKVKCIYIDPPFNTEATGTMYEDNIEHSVWLHLMSQRFEYLRRLLTPDGLLWVHLDDEEAAYAKVLLDEIFGRKCYRNTITVKANSPFGFKHTGENIFKSANQIIVYSRSPQVKINTVWLEREYDTAYKYVLENRDAPYTEWCWTLISDVIAKQLGYDSARRARQAIGQDFEKKIAEYAISNANRIFRTAAPSGGAKAKRIETIKKSAIDRDHVYVHPNDDMGYFFIAGERVLFYDERLVDIDGRNVPGEVITDIWLDISWEGIAKEGGVDFPKGKKPEALVRRVIESSTAPGDLVLDSFLGSGTTAAVAHKMGRKWIGIELGEHCHTHVIPRLQSVVDGKDESGVTHISGWMGGGGFRYYKLAPSLLEKDEFGNWIISKEYNPAMLAEAVCKLEGYRYCPSDSVYWQHGKSSEDSFIYVTTQTLTVDQLRHLNEEVGPKRSLLICCGSFMAKNLSDFSRLVVKKIPKAVLHKCEWDHDDYSLEIKNLPVKSVEARPEIPSESLKKAVTKEERRKTRTLFEYEEG